MVTFLSLGWSLSGSLMMGVVFGLGLSREKMLDRSNPVGCGSE